MTMKLRPGIAQPDIDLFCKRASRVALSQVVENVVVHEQSRIKGEARRTVFTIDIVFFPEEEYVREYDVNPLEILSMFTVRFPLTLKREIANEMKRLDADLRSQIAELGKGKKVSREDGGNGDEEEGEGEAPQRRRADDEESEAGDGDADDEKRARQKKQQATYESDDEEDDGGEGEFRDEDIEAAYAEDEEDTDTDEGERKKNKKKLSSLEEEVGRVENSFTSHLHHATSFTFNPSQCTFELEVSSC
jgi:DNA-directed RNA polymerase I subunit RPA1